MKSRKIVSLPQSILVSGCLAVLLLPVGALGSKHDLWEFTTGFTIVATGVMLSTICVFLVVSFRHGADCDGDGAGAGDVVGDCDGDFDDDDDDDDDGDDEEYGGDGYDKDDDV